MNLTYKEFLKLLSENTREYIENVMNELYYYERLSTTSDNNRYFNIIRACYIGMEKDIAYTDFIKKMKFDSSNIDNSSKSRIYYDFKKIPASSKEEIFRKYNSFFILQDSIGNSKYFQYLKPSEILYDAVKNFIVRCNYKEDYAFSRVVGVERNSDYPDLVSELVKRDREQVNVQLERELYKDLNYEVISFVECASKIRNKLSICLERNVIRESNYIRDTSDYLTPLSLFLAIFEYDGKKVNAIEKIFNDKGITLFKIYKALGKNFSKEIKEEKKDIRVIDKFYRPYLDKHISELVKKLFTKELVPNNCVEKFISQFDVEALDIVDLRESLFALDEFDEKQFDEFYHKLKLQTKISLNDTAKIYQLLLTQLDSNFLLTSTDDIDTLAILISSYYHNGIVSEYFKDNGIALENILDLLNINITKEELKNVAVDKKVFMKKFKRFIVDGVNSDRDISKVTPTDFEKNLCNQNFNKTNIVQGIFENFTGKGLPSNFIKELDDYIVTKRKEKAKKELVEYLEEKNIEDVDFLFKVLDAYEHFLLSNTSSSKRLLMEASIITAFGMTDIGSKYLSLIHFDYEKFLVQANIKNEKVESTELRDLAFKENLEPFINNNDTTLSITVNLLKSPDISSEVKKFIDDSKYEVLTEEEFYYQQEINVKTSEVKERLKKNLSEDMLGFIESSFWYYPRLRIVEDSCDRKCMSLFLGIMSSLKTKVLFEKYGFDCKKIIDDFVVDSPTSKQVADNLYLDFELFSKEKLSDITIINDLFANNYIKRLCEKNNISIYNLEYELLLKTGKLGSLSIPEKKQLLEATELPSVNPFNNSSLINYSNVLSFHSKSIEKPYQELLSSNSISTATNMIHDTIDDLYKEQIEKPSFFQQLFSLMQEEDKDIVYNKEAMIKLREELDKQSDNLEKEIKTYAELIDYMKAFYKKNEDRIVEMDSKMRAVEDLQNSEEDDDTFGLIKYQSTLNIMSSYKNSFVTTGNLCKAEIIRVYNSIVSHFMVLNSIRTTKEVLVPIIESESIISKGIENEKDIIGVIHEISDLFNNMVENNTEGISANLAKLDNLSVDNYASLTNGINKFLEDTSNISSSSDKIKVKLYKKED